MGIATLVRALASAAANPVAARSVVSAAIGQSRGLLGAIGTRYYSPCRYEEAHTAAYKAIKSGKLDKHSFYTWQDLINYLAVIGDGPAAVRAHTHAHRHGENPVVPYIHEHQSYTIEPDHQIKLTTAEEHTAIRFAVKAKNADRALETELANADFKTWEALKQYYYETENFRNHALVGGKIDKTKETIKAVLDPRVRGSDERKMQVQEVKSQFIKDYLHDHNVDVSEAIRAYRVSSSNILNHPVDFNGHPEDN